ncbi:hypothetical protein J1614_010390 [Plenodomus biglobosus]|nr:hypothetical protein J1614_010390 [Plenodomus biglobosus]
MKAILAASTLIALAATSLYHLRQIQTAIQPIPLNQITSTPSVPASLSQGPALAIVNPNQHIPIHDSRQTTLQVPLTLSHQEILARFTKGFFGGHVFAPERSILRLLHKEILHFRAIQSIPVSSYIWAPAQLSTHALPPLHALLFGAFRLVHVQLDGRESHVDFAFGADEGAIAGVHRFEVFEVEGEGVKAQTEGYRTVVIRFAHAGCNPREDKPLEPAVLQTLHLWYAMLLFREGVAEVGREV